MANKYYTYDDHETLSWNPPEDVGGREPDDANSPGARDEWRYLGFNAEIFKHLIVVFDGITVPTDQPTEINFTEVDLSADSDLRDKFVLSMENTRHIPQRAMLMPGVGDQLDGILKYLKAQRDAGGTLNDDLDRVITEWEAAKTAVPKPGLVE
jgi:hypothetical protein